MSEQNPEPPVEEQPTSTDSTQEPQPEVGVQSAPPEAQQLPATEQQTRGTPNGAVVTDTGGRPQAEQSTGRLVIAPATPS